MRVGADNRDDADREALTSASLLKKFHQRCVAVPHGPIRVIVFNEIDEDVLRPDAGLLLQKLGYFLMKLNAQVAAPAASQDNIDDDEVISAGNIQKGRMIDKILRVIFIDDVKLIFARNPNYLHQSPVYRIADCATILR